MKGKKIFAIIFLDIILFLILKIKFYLTAPHRVCAILLDEADGANLQRILTYFQLVNRREWIVLIKYILIIQKHHFQNFKVIQSCCLHSQML